MKRTILKFFVRPEVKTATVYRMDTHGNKFIVKTGMPVDQAQALAEKMEALGHRQTYWVENDAQNSAPNEQPTTKSHD